MSTQAKNAYVIGTWDTKGAELDFLSKVIQQAGVPVVRVDVGTSGDGTWPVDYSARTVAAAHEEGESAVLNLGDRGKSVAAMSCALLNFIRTRDDVGGVVGAGGTGNTALVAPAFRSLPIGIPKILVSTVASGDVSAYVGPSDLTMMHSVADVQGLNQISRKILANAAHALAGMIKEEAPSAESAATSAVGMTMFGVTTPCVQQVAKLLGDDYDCIVFHATGIGGQCLEKLVDSGLLSSVIDITTTEVPDMLLGGVFPATSDRFGAIARTRVPYVGSCGALDMVNFRAIETVPERYRQRLLHVHNPQITLMRTTAEELMEIGAWVAERLNRCEGQVRFLLPLDGVSALDAPGQPFWNPDADKALFDTIENQFSETESRRLVKVEAHINDPKFADAVVEQFKSINPGS